MWTLRSLCCDHFNINNLRILISVVKYFLIICLLNNIHFINAQDLRTDSSSQTPAVGGWKGTKCYDNFRRPQKCIPGFENAAFAAHITATNTCGEDGPIEFCVQTNPSESRRICQLCKKGDHGSEFLTDIHSQDNVTWWQSETMYEDIQYPNQVNLTLSFGKSFDITYVRLEFYSPRPESFSIYKRVCEECPWIPYQFFSLSCRDIYKAPNSLFAPIGDDTQPLCTSEYSEMIPLQGGNVLFSTLAGRPNAINFATNEELQEFVKATDIRISLDRLNTFGDELFGDPRVLRSYFYAISDIAVGARCTCNGHAAECVESKGADGSRRRVCLCEHNTMGPDCNECLPFYNDVPWKRATTADAHECKPCNCNGFSNRCIFDEALYNRTGHGGYCLECTANRDGPNCERCRENYYQQEDGFCRPCQCNEVGSRSLQCDRKGQCQCKPGVTGEKCDRCAENFYDFGPHGCKQCGCLREGSLDNIPKCDPVTGVCYCKENIEGKRCRQCKPGFFNLDENNEFGCTPCFCYGHSSVCRIAPGYSQVTLHSFFDRSSERWTALDDQGRNVPLNYNGLVQNIGVSAPDRGPVYLIAPDRFLGDQRASYNKDLKFSLRIGENGASPTVNDIILEGSGILISNTIFGLSNKLPSIENQEFQFRLHEHPAYKWQPRLSARAFMAILTNLTAIRIRATYTPRGVGFLDDFRLESALRGAAGESANWIEMCECPVGYVGQFCESCAAGYRHSPALGGPFTQCEPCDCNKHAEHCDSETGRCKCEHNTAGDNCELCARGYYGNALIGTRYDCKPCGCPNNGPCIQLPDEKLICLECPTGYTGPQCDLCTDGYFGDPKGLLGTVKACLPCICNHNIDTNAVGNCNRTTGTCLKCIYNTYGESCEQCLPGYYGDALAIPKGDCKPCSCYPPGTQEADDGILICDQLSGQCLCKPHVHGRNCDQCEVGYFNIESDEGCQPCNCDSIGSFNNTCDIRTGQCFCRPGVTGLRCDKCEEYKYGFSREGCKSCDCDRIGSSGLHCDHTGQCPCRTNVEGKKCDRCKENKYDRQQGCIDCPPAYNLVQEAVHEHQEKLARLQEVLSGIRNNPTVIDGSEFDEKLKQVQNRIDDLNEQAKQGTEVNGRTLTEQIDDIKNHIEAIDELLNSINNKTTIVEQYADIASNNVTETEIITAQAKQILNEAVNQLSVKGKEALDRANTKSREYGYQNAEMENITREARTKADALEEEAKNILNLAKEAEDVSQQAYKTAKSAIDKQQNTSEQLGSLRAEIASAKEKLEDTQRLTKDAKNRAQEVHKEALNILNEVQAINIPQVNIKQLQKESEWKQEDAKNLLENLDKLEDDNKETVENVLKLIEDANDLYQSAEAQQQTIDELLSDADDTFFVAENAVQRGNETWQQAQDTYQTLSNYDNQVNQHKQDAQKAIDEVERIREALQAAQQQTRDAENTLNKIYKVAENAKDNALNAQNNYTELAADTNSMLDQANDLKTVAGKLRVEANDFAERVAETGNTLKKLEDQATNDKDLISEAKKKLGQAGKYSSEASNQVKKAVNDVEEIIKILNDLPSITSANLDELEQKLQRAEKELLEANLDNQIQNLRDEKQRQAILIDNYKNRVAQLEKDVEIIKDISNSLPMDCFKRTKLEP